MPLVRPLGLLSIHPRRDPARTAVDSRTGRQGSVSACREDRGMALANIQREVCRVVTKQRIASGESDVADRAAWNTLPNAPRVSARIPRMGGDCDARREVRARGEIRFHAGSIRGAFPNII